MTTKRKRSGENFPSRLGSADGLQRPAFGANQGRYGQGGLSRTRSNIQNCVPTANQPILDKSLRDWRKHLPDDFAVILPEGRGITPYVYNLVVGLRRQKYTYLGG